MRVALGIEYDGTSFSGWERQRDRRTVQDVLESALAQIAVEPIGVVCAGRTDAGVHATCQVVHFDTGAERPERAWVMGTNTALPPDAAVLWARPVADDFHARFRALRRSYRYVICERRVRSPLWRHRATWSYRALDAARMDEGARHLLGRHDFSGFRAAGCQARSPVRTVHAIAVAREGPFLYLDVTADAFLQHMVRNVAGVLLAIGAGEAEPGWAREVLEGRDRTLGGVTAPPDGLYLVGVEYGDEWGLPSLCRWRALW